MKTIFKYRLRVVDRQTLPIPTGFKVRYVGTQDREVMVWIELDDSHDTAPVDFLIIGTGEAVPPEGIYIGTTIVGYYVWHVYVAVPE